jgi:diguanylate cyclase (GGDEF)-like protein/PAS domain S-box-containing protein
MVATPVPAPPDVPELEPGLVQSLLATASVTLTGCFVAVNDALCRLLHRRPDELVGHLVTEFVASEAEAAETMGLLRMALAGERDGAQIDRTLVRGDGKALSVGVTCTLIRDADGAPWYVSLHYYDITQRVEAERAVRASEARWRALLAHAVDVTYTAGADRIVATVSSSLSAQLGWQPDEVQGRSVFDLLHPDDLPAVQAAWARVDRHHGSQAVVECRIRHADGSWHWVQQTLSNQLRVPHVEAIVGNIVDITERKQREQLMARSEARFRARFEQSRVAQAFTDLEGRIVAVNQACCDLVGRSADQVVGARVRDLDHAADDGDAVVATIRVLTGEQPSAQVERVLVHVDGRPLPVMMDVALMHEDDGTPFGLAVYLHDLTSLRDSEARQREQQDFFLALNQRSSDAAMVTDAEGQVTYASAATKRLFGYESTGRDAPVDWEPFVHPDDVPALRRTFAGVLRTGGSATALIRVRTGAAGEWRWVEDTLTNLLHTSLAGVVCNLTDVTERVEAEQALRDAALHDALTGLPNRTLLADRLEHAVQRQRANANARLGDGAGATAVLFIDLDHFKLVNDSRGHHVGDAVIVAVADRLRAAVPASDTVARFGGDEFVVLVEDIDETAACALAAELLRALTVPVDVGGEQLHVNASIGIVLSPPVEADDLLRYADAAMYEAKSAGRGRCMVFDRALADRADQRFALAADLRHALATDALELHYQPIIDLETDRVVAVEALARWHHPGRGWVSPLEFVGIAEQVGISASLDRWVLRRALRQVGALIASGILPADIGISVNVSAGNVADRGLELLLLEASAGSGLAPEQVILEITESAVMDDAERAIDVLRALRRHGFRVAIDDFGTGYSSLAYLRQLPVTSLKIDKAFIDDLGDADGLAIVASIIDLARAVGVTLVAEGVETREQAMLLRELGCDRAQGWLWSPAVSVAALELAGEVPVHRVGPGPRS